MVDDMDIFAVIQDIFRQVFDDDNLAVSSNTGHEQIAGWDSVAQVKLVLALEEEFSIRFTMDEVSSMTTVDDFVKAVEAHIKNK
jgi:acyl carrier protein